MWHWSRRSRGPSYLDIEGLKRKRRREKTLMGRRERQVLLGNEAIAVGLVEGGCQVIAGYPGTPSSEILPSAVKWGKKWSVPMYAEWSTNEKVAFDQAYAAAVVGKRAACCMKQVGLNVACDSLTSATYTGVSGALVVVSCDDPGPHSSQTEQDSRRMAWLAKVPVLDPQSPAQARWLAREALDISHRFSIPVMLRSVTRLSHARQVVEVNGPPPGMILPKASFPRDPCRWAATPRFRFLLHAELNEKLRKMEALSNRYARAFFPSSSTAEYPLGVVASGVPALVAKELLEERGFSHVPFLEITMPFPFPRKRGAIFLERCKVVLVLEEPDAFIEVHLQERNKVLGRMTGHVPKEGELLPEILDASLEKALVDAGIKKRARRNRRRDALLQRAMEEAKLPRRRPTLCPGCPHRASFFAIKRAFPKAIYPSDIGCYTLGANLGVVDTVLDMGSGITMASGLYHAFQLDGLKRPIVATMGDSTFYHSGTAALLNAVHTGSRFVLVILDNGVTAMTGMQSTPAWDHGPDGSAAIPIPLERVVRGCGVEFLAICDPYNLEDMVKTLKEAWQYASSPEGSVAVVIARHPCLLHEPKAREIRGPLPKVTDRCKGCRYCLEQFECPALIWDEKGERVTISEGLCSACGVCLLVCPKGAIIRGEDG